MKTKQTLTLIFNVLFLVALSQTPKKTYYDFKKTMIKEDYFVNAAGEKNGPYKGYNEKGIVVEEANFKNGQLNGVYKKYTAYSGKKEIAKSETYKDGVLDGLAIYYGENGLVLKQGNYKNDKKDGKWTFMDPYSNYNFKNQEALKGAQFVKSEATYVNGEPLMNGKYITYYYPSGKVRSEVEYTNGTETGEQKWYYPDGTNEAYYKFDGLTKNYLVKKSYYPNGNVMENSRMENGKWVYEGYTEDGKQDQLTQNLKYENEQNEKEKQKASKDAETDKVWIAKGDSLFNKKEYYASLQFYREIKTYDTRMNTRNVSTIERLAKLQDYANQKNLDQFNSYLESLNGSMQYITDNAFKDLMKQHIEYLKTKINTK
jgi:antitoxin component YwqK of YwqJK toxin-antitoxin module